MQKLQKNILFSVVGLTTLLATACGQAGQSNNSGSASSDKSVPIGALVPITGAGGTYGSGMLDAIKIAVDEVNSAGGVAGGYHFKLFSADTQTNPNDSVVAAQKLLDVNKVQAILGTWASADTLAVAPKTIAAHVVEMNTSGAPALTTLKDDNYVFRTQATDTLYGKVFAQWAVKHGYKTATTMGLNNPAAQGIIDGFDKYYQEHGGKILGAVNYEANQTSYNNELSKALQPKPDVVILGSYQPDATIILKEAYEQGSKVNFIGPAFGINNAVVKALGADALQNVTAIDPIADKEADAYKDLAAKYQKDNNGQDLFSNSYAAQAYDMVNLVALAMEKAKSTKAADWHNALQEVSGPAGEKVSNFADGKKLIDEGKQVNYEGASGPIDFDAAGDIIAKFGIFQVKNGSLALTTSVDPREQQ